MLLQKGQKTKKKLNNYNPIENRGKKKKGNVLAKNIERGTPKPPQWGTLRPTKQKSANEASTVVPVRKEGGNGGSI